MNNLLKNKKMLLGLLVVGAVAYYFWNKNHEGKEKAGLLPADES